ncbi:hypothetical protein BFINE_06450 [Bacteroides finegoldii DSM 17565]|nr:hypothetical protein BFINE_06450 [Bacteroides finegoldii DSM 17565]
MLKHMEQKNESTPLVTVITATYNLIENKRAKFIIQCLGSVHNQHYSNIEHIVIDGHLMMVLYHYLKNMRVKVG